MSGLRAWVNHRLTLLVPQRELPHGTCIYPQSPAWFRHHPNNDAVSTALDATATNGPILCTPVQVRRRPEGE